MPVGEPAVAGPPAAFAPPGVGPLDEPPPAGMAAPVPSGRLARGFWPVPCLLVADDGGARLHIAVSGGTTVHAVVAATVRSSGESIVEIEAPDGRRFRYAPVAGIRVVAGDVLKAGAVLGTVAGEHAAHLELAVRDPDGRWVDPYPLLVGLADPNELGMDARTGDGVDPDSLLWRPAVVKQAPFPAPDALAALAATPEPLATPEAAAPSSPASALPATALPAPALPAPSPGAALPPPAPAPEPATAEPPREHSPAEPAPSPAVAPAAEERPASRIASDILASMIAPTPPAHSDQDDD